MGFLFETAAFSGSEAGSGQRIRILLRRRTNRRAISKPAPEHEGERFVQTRVGLHHVCFRARSREDVDEAHAFLKTLDATIIRAPQEDGWAPGYYSILFEDPDGVRLELNFVPGKGVFGMEEKALKPTYPESKLG